MKSVGEKIKEARKAKRLRLADLAELVSMPISTISSIENNALKTRPSAEVVIAIAGAIGDDSILMHYIESDPVYQHVLPKIFPDLNNIRRDPAIIFTRLASEADEAAESARIMAELFSNADPARVPNFDATFRARMEQIVDIKRAVEILEFQLISSKTISKNWLHEVYAQQQGKCVERGHHLEASANG